MLISGNSCINSGSVGYVVGFGTHTKEDSNVTITNNVIIGAKAHGIAVSAPVAKRNNNITITGNTIRAFGRVTASSSGISVSYADRVFIAGNTIDGDSNTNAANGVYVGDTTDVTITGNFVCNNPNGYGITTENSTSAVISGNSIYDVASYNVRALATMTASSVINNWADDSFANIDGAVYTANNKFG